MTAPFLHLMRRLFVFALLLLPVAAFAAYSTSNISHYRDADALSDRPTAVAVSFLTQEGILSGYPDRTLRPDVTVNRAEFLKMAMIPYIQAHENPFSGYDYYKGGVFDAGQHCFPDVSLDDWFGEYVCEAKFRSFVQGNPDGLYHPERTVNYAEALKMLSGTFALSITAGSGEVWYQPFLTGAEEKGINLPDAAPGHALSRGEVAQLVASFLASRRGELPELRAAQEGQSASSASSFSCNPTICPDGTSQPTCTADGHPIMYFADPCLTHQRSSSSSSDRTSEGVLSSLSSSVIDPGPDFSQLPALLRLGTVSSILGAAKIFNNAEPFTVDEIDVVFTGNVGSVDQVRLYATANGRYLGGATRDSTTAHTFILSIPGGILSISKREEGSVYARAILSPFDGGGVSGETVAIDYFTIKGRGDWSTRRYTQSSTDTFGTFQTARSTFTAITNAGSADGALIAGPGRTLGAFSFAGGIGDGSADLRLTDLTFVAGTSGGVTLSNVKLGVDGSTERFSCSVVGTSVLCPSLPESIGTVGNGSRVLSLYGDIAVPSASLSAGLQMSLTPAGSATSAGAITWTDGTTSYQWVPFEEAGLRGTYYRQ